MRMTSAAVAAAVGLPALTRCGDPAGPEDGWRSPLVQPPNLGATGVSLTARPGIATISEGESTDAWLFNGSLPGPTLRARLGDTARIDLVNALSGPTVVHWHGMLVPEEADGHPRNAIAAGSSYAYEFPVRQRAGTCWYHPHAHHHTGEQIQRGLAGFFLVGDDEEAALALPGGEQEVLLMLQDRAAAVTEAFAHAPSAADLHDGVLRGTPYGNGVRRPALDVGGGCYRFRLLNASHARVYRIAVSSGAPLTVIGNDGGLLPAVAEVPSVWLGVGERTDFLLDFTDVPVGTRLMIRSLPFDAPGSGGKSRQGMAMDLLELVRVDRSVPGRPALPAVLSSVVPLGMPIRERTFAFRTTVSQEMHQINGLTFDMERVDVTVPFGEVERWIFRNDSTLPHPVHMHGTQFQIVARSGGRGSVLPYEAGWKDTALLMPDESVEALVRFDAYRGRFLLHCHNLQHEDMGMMLNVEVV
jgi:FtsP/CotA-like multicopper oxidase with cupredoxin domain